MYSEVIVAHDGSALATSAVEPARQLGTAWNCPVAVVHVTTGAGGPLPDGDGLPVETLQSDDVPGTLIDLQQSRQALLCLASRGRSVVSSALFGSVTVELLRRTHTPLVLTGPGLDDGPQPLSTPRHALVCLDGSSTSASIIPVAHQWARELGLHLTFVHIAYPPGDRGMDSGAVDDDTVTAIDRVVRAGRQTVLEGMDASWSVVRHATPSAGIIAEARHHSADLIMMATHGRTGLERVLVGSVTSEVVRHASLPVVVCRPHELT